MTAGWGWRLPGSVMGNGFSLWTFSFPSAPVLWSRAAHLEDMKSWSSWINGTLIFLHASGCASPSAWLLPAGPPENGPRAGLMALPTGPGGRAGRGEGLWDDRRLPPLDD